MIHYFKGGRGQNHMAGANIPAALLAWSRGEKPQPSWLKTDVGVFGYKDLVPIAVKNFAYNINE